MATDMVQSGNTASGNDTNPSGTTFQGQLLFCSLIIHCSLPLSLQRQTGTCSNPLSVCYHLPCRWHLKVWGTHSPTQLKAAQSGITR